ncbi:acyl-CoA ligase (AMP-forming), exosortase A system-associated [Agrococcus carbonis]|uniref:Acyl-CoA ligase (AMP-forming), exosortase A-associated n=1 Tax=Agrococcus carbonis TaxID=684552 RepID=A0A1H1LCX5_9MICO|nr:acyl-CoA ligase (AMP-forming), exosortase A system-associated [Agrococcus carbonis]SDR72172.1 acyl-CoA ligase (AMP-forming), exosortase A-associated [Agrococcus carbonis]
MSAATLRAPIARTNLHHLLEQAAERTPSAPALTFGETSVTYGDLWRIVRDAACGLAAAGVRRGDRVAIYLEKRIETVAAIFAASVVGGLFVPINPVLKPAQVRHILRDSGARLLVTSAHRLPVLVEAVVDAGVRDVVLVDGSGPVGARFAVHAWGSGAGAEAPRSGAIDLDAAAILYTSGSTGSPKGVVLSHRNLIAGAESVSAYLEQTADDVILSLLPLSFDAGLSQVTTAFAVGAHVILLNYLLAREVPRVCERHGVTAITGVPPLWVQLVEATWPEATAHRLRYWANTGGRMPRALLDRLRATFPEARPFLMYGLTEAFRSTYLDPAEIDRRPESIGKAIPNAEILVLRPDGSRCAAGEEGELVHRGALVSLGYWNDADRTAERFRPVDQGDAGWRAPERAVWSGDTVVADEDGFLYFVGRRDDMIKTSGYRVSPTEIEEAAFATGLVRDAVAIGVADASLGQRIVLVASASGQGTDAGAVLRAMRTLLPLYMVPSEVVLRDAMPRSPNGKYDRALIRAEAAR